MRKTTKGHGMAGAVIAAILVGGLVFLLTVTLAVEYFGESGTHWTMTALVLAYVLAGLAVVGGIIAALIQRWREVRGGEEDEARKY